jgi:hypothetical protein
MIVADTADQPRTLARPRITRAPAPVMPPKLDAAAPVYYERVKDLLDRWAEWMSTESGIARGAPRQCHGAPDARIHSFEDMEIEVNKQIVRAVDAVVWALPVLEREAVMLNYGLMKAKAWRANFDALFDQAIHSLFAALKNRLAC